MDNRRRRGRAARIRVAGGERYEAQLVARKFRVGLAVVLSVIKRVGNLRSRSLRRTQATDVQASSRGEEELRRVSDGAGQPMSAFGGKADMTSRAIECYLTSCAGCGIRPRFNYCFREPLI